MADYGVPGKQNTISMNDVVEEANKGIMVHLDLLEKLNARLNTILAPQEPQMTSSTSYVNTRGSQSELMSKVQNLVDRIVLASSRVDELLSRLDL